jgi:hypothetical protein
MHTCPQTTCQATFLAPGLQALATAPPNVRLGIVIEADDDFAKQMVEALRKQGKAPC